MQRHKLPPTLSLVIALLLILIFTTPVQADGPTGEVDLSFGGFGRGGQVVFDNQFTAVDFAQQADGKIVVIGYFRDATYATIFRYTAQGGLDPSFNGTGGLHLPLEHRCYWNEGCAVAVQSDGKIVVAFSATGTGKYDMVVARFHVNGVIDTGFGLSGMRAIDFYGEPDIPYDIVIQPDGKIVVVGTALTDFDNVSFPSPQEKQDQVMTIARLNANGTLDQPFAGWNGRGGIRAFSFGANENDDNTDTAIARQVAIRPNGRIVMAGHVRVKSLMADTDLALVQLRSDGSLDSGFTNNGQVVIDVNGFDYGYGLTLHPDGRLMVAGESGFYTGSLVRVRANGTLDTSFYGNGKFLYEVPSQWTGLRAVSMQPNGKVVAAGQYSTDGSDGLLLMRLNVGSIFDGSFFGDGTSNIYPGEGIGLILQADGKYLVLQQDRMSRFLPHGSYDEVGRTISDFENKDDRAWAATLQTDGKIILAGEARHQGDSKKYMALARYLRYGTLDPTFGAAGKQYAVFDDEDGANDVIVHPNNNTIIAAGFTKRNDFDFAVYLFSSFGSIYPAGMTAINMGNGDDFAQAVLLQPDGKIVVAGFATLSTGSDPNRRVFAVARLLADGTTLDPNFGNNGKVMTGVGSGSSARVRSALLQPDGKIIVVGSHGGEVVVVRYLTNGGLDPEFGQGGLVRITGGTIEDEGGGELTLDHPMDSANAVALLAQGNIAIAGQSNNDFGLLIVGPNGGNCTICGTTLGNEPYWLEIEAGSATSNSAYDLAVQPDGKIILAGNLTGSGPFIIARVRPKGNFVVRNGYELDPTFEGDGLSYVSAYGQESLARAVLLKGDTIIVAGHSKAQSDYHFSLAVLNNDVDATPPTETPPTPPRAQFTADNTSGQVPLTVSFADSSSGEIDSWLWEFGDGATSTEQNPSHTYTTVGNFSVGLTVSGPGGTDIQAVGNFVIAAPVPAVGDQRVYLPLVQR